MSNANKWSIETATAAVKALTALGAKAKIKADDAVVGNDVVQVLSVHASVENNMGSGYTHTAQSPDGFDAAAIVADLKKQAGAAAKATRSAIRRERAQS